MATAIKRATKPEIRQEGMRLGGEKVLRDRVIEVFNP